MSFDFSRHAIFAGVAGSWAYGLSTPSSDVDVRGICIPPKRYWFSASLNFEQLESKRDEVTLYGIKKFFALAIKANPNIIELLWMPQDCILFQSDLMDEVLEKRHLFLSAKAMHSFSGYAFSQLKRIKGHRSWLLEPPDHEPTREEFGLPADQREFDSLKAAIETAGQADLEPYELYGKQMDALRRYKTARARWKQYEDWKRTRNPDRAALESEHGYDTKHAAHLIRLLRMGGEILERGEVNTRRADAQELLAIRNEGIWTYDELISWAEQEEQRLERIYDSRQYVVPRKPDLAAIDELLQRVAEKSFESEPKGPTYEELLEQRDAWEKKQRIARGWE
ncbi:MAG: nucleotidyltransferase domain-containing protein [Polyangia bacterium]